MDGQEKLVAKRTILGTLRGGPSYISRTMTVAKTGVSIAKRREIVAELRDQGLTQTEIAQRVGVSQVTVSNDLRPPRRK